MPETVRTVTYPWCTQLEPEPVHGSQLGYAKQQKQQKLNCFLSEKNVTSQGLFSKL